MFSNFPTSTPVTFIEGVPPGLDPDPKHAIFHKIFIIGTKRSFGVESKRYIACEQALCLGKKERGKGRERGGKKPPAIPPSCNYPADHLSVRSLSVNQFRAWEN